VRVGLFGGTFDPPHRGHVELALTAARTFRLDRVWLVPARVPPHKHAAHADPFHRYAMTALCCDGKPLLAPHPAELLRDGPSYTVVTLAEMAAAAPRPLLLLGSDSLGEFPGWCEPQRILELASLGVLERAGHPMHEVVPALPAWLRERVVPVSGVENSPLEPGRVLAAPARLPDICSKEVRRRLVAGASVAGLVEPSVLEYMEKQGIYTR
jgi:nicotinate (nicotinamide) nucleotide adenylyltransferase